MLVNNKKFLMSLLEMGRSFQKEIVEMKETMRSNHQDEVRKIEQNFQLQKEQIEEIHQYECDAYKADIKHKSIQINNLSSIINSLKINIDSQCHFIDRIQQDLSEKNQILGTLQANLAKNVDENIQLKQRIDKRDHDYDIIKNDLDDKIQSNKNL